MMGMSESDQSPLPVTVDLPTAPAPMPNAIPTEGPSPAQDAREQSLATLSPGRFGRYRLERLLGKGGMGEVYLAHDSVLGRIVALKIPRLLNSNPVQRERFFREARAAAVLTHPSICRVLDVGEEDGRPYLTMAYVEG